jgi:hypothetical protein
MTAGLIRLPGGWRGKHDRTPGEAQQIEQLGPRLIGIVGADQRCTDEAGSGEDVPNHVRIRREERVSGGQYEPAGMAGHD